MTAPITSAGGVYAYNGGVSPRILPDPATTTELESYEIAAQGDLQIYGVVAAPPALEALWQSQALASVAAKPQSAPLSDVATFSRCVADWGGAFDQSQALPEVYRVSRLPYPALNVEGIVDGNSALLPQPMQDEHGWPVPERPLRVIHAGPFFRQGGAERWLLDLVSHADPRYVRFVRCICTDPAAIDFSYISELSGLGVVLEAGGGDSLRQAAADADVLLSWGIALDEFLGDARPPLSVQVVHGDGPMNRYFVAHSRNAIDHTVAVSHRVRARICHDVPSTVIYNGVDAARLAPRRPGHLVRRVLGLDETDFVVGFVGRFAPEKRVEVIIDSVAALPERFKLLLVGWGPLLSQLRALAADRLPGRHVIAHAGKDLGDLYRAMDVTCLVSNQEGFPLVMLEAMLCERPLVSTPVGCMPEIIEDRVNGLLTDGSAEDLAAALQRLADHPRWARGLAAEGAALAKRFAFASRMARDYEHLLHDLWQAKATATAG